MAATLALLLICMCGQAAAAENAAAIRHEPATLCAQCHSNAPAASAMRDRDGQGIAPFDLWSGTVMANASRDPFFRAVVSVEQAATPSAAEEIERLCFRCHSPTTAEPPPVEAANDGVTCTVCHQISENGLGHRDSFSGGFVFADTGEIFGPHRDVMPMPMMHHTGFRPTHAEHVTRSALCATCHTLFTDALAADGSSTGARLAEQTPYLEWRNSVFNDENGAAEGGSGCPACHMRTHDSGGKQIRTAIARNPHGRDFGFAGPRSPYGLHAVLGPNDQLGRLLGQSSPVSPFVPDDRGAAEITIGTPLSKQGSLRIPVTVHNLTGHKYPTGHPSRRAWLRFVARAADGGVLFASGAFDPLGRLVDAAGALLPGELVGGRPEAHHDVIASASDVAIYEAVMEDAAERPTYLLLRGTAFAKDSRLLPEGWSHEHPDAGASRPMGIGDDPSFVAGGDTVEYRVPVPQGVEIAVVEVDLFYQSWGARYLAEVSSHETAEMVAFLQAYQALDKTPRRVASARRDVAASVSGSPGDLCQSGDLR